MRIFCQRSILEATIPLVRIARTRGFVVSKTILTALAKIPAVHRGGEKE